jgi:hypothetical protein
MHLFNPNLANKLADCRTVALLTLFMNFLFSLLQNEVTAHPSSPRIQL